MIYVTASIPSGCVQYLNTQLPSTQSSEIYVPSGCAPKIKIIAGVPSGSVHKIYITASVPSLYTSSDIGLVYPAVMYTRSISQLAYLTTPNFLQRTQFLNTQGSKQYVLNGCTLNISTFYCVLNMSIHKAL